MIESEKVALFALMIGLLITWLSYREGIEDVQTYLKTCMDPATFFFDNLEVDPVKLDRRREWCVERVVNNQWNK